MATDTKPVVSGIYISGVESVVLVKDHRKFGNLTIYLKGEHDWDYTRVEVARNEAGELPSITIEDLNLELLANTTAE